MTDFNGIEMKKGKGSDEAEITIYDFIGGGGWEPGISDKDFREALLDLGDVKRLNVKINSGGGSVFQGVAIANELKMHEASVTVTVTGLAASIASVIAMAADPGQLVMCEDTMMMIHPPSGMVWGTAEEMRKEANLLDQIENQIVDTYRRRTGLSRTKIKDYVKAETWFEAEEAVRLGFADRVEGTGEDVTNSTRMEWMNSNFRNIPTKLVAQYNAHKERESRKASQGRDRGRELDLMMLKHRIH